MALIARVGRIRLTNDATSEYREWTYVFPNENFAAGSANHPFLDESLFQSPTASAAPGPATTTSREVRPSDTTTAIRTYASALPPVEDQFFATDNGFSQTDTTRWRSGMVYGRFRVQRIEAGITIYDINNYDTTGTVPTGHSVQRDIGWAIATTTGTLYLTNKNPGGINNIPPDPDTFAELEESLWGRIHLAHRVYQSLTVNFGIQQGGLNIIWPTIMSTGDNPLGRYERAFGPVVDDRFARTDDAVAQQATLIVTFSNGTIGGVSTNAPYLRLSPLPTNPTLRMDPRLDVWTLFQIDDNAWSTPPMSSPTHNTEFRRQTLEQAFIAHRFSKRRTGNLMTNTQFRFTRELIPMKPGAKVSEAGVALTTQGGEAGWSSTFFVWQSALPGGAWSQNVVITAPSTMDAAGMVATVFSPIYLVARNTDYQPQAILGNTGARGRHLNPGDTLLLGMRVKDTKSGMFVTADTDAIGPLVYCSIERVNATATGTDYLDANMVWQPAQDANGAPLTVYEHRVPAINAGTYRMAISGTVTRAWDDSDLIVTLRMIIGGAPYTLYATREVAAKFNNHDRNYVNPIHVAL